MMRMCLKSREEGCVSNPNEHGEAGRDQFTQDVVEQGNGRVF